jgi:hypothetical protein
MMSDFQTRKRVSRKRHNKWLARLRKLFNVTVRLTKTRKDKREKDPYIAQFDGD